jgi:PAS domain S-box-containing protein
VCSVTKVALNDGSGKLIGLVGISRDITEEKRIERQLRQLSTAVEQSPASILITDPRGRIEYVNPSFSTNTGYALEEVMGEDISALKSPAGGNGADQKWWQRAAEGNEWQGEIQSRRKDGTTFWESSHISPIKSQDGAITQLLVICEDATERKIAEAKLREAQTELIHTSLLAGRAEVATSVLHNVGNVLNSLNVSTTVLADSLKNSKVSSVSRVAALLREQAADLGRFVVDDPKGKQLPAYLEQLGHYLDKEQAHLLRETELIRQNLEHVKEIVAMQQNYARISGVSELVKASELADDALRLNARALERHRVRVIREYQPNMPEITTEKHKVLQVLVNLISNAKYACDHSGLDERLVTAQVCSNDHRVRFVITDNGEGIPAENLTRIFSNGFTTRKNGHGFGLHSAALAAKELGGSLSVKSDGSGKGATFTLEFPITRDVDTETALQQAGEEA